ncbi:NAD nucleotidase [Sulfurovum sp.]|uniref:NAD nucleotidase n=1 Tax=Sulfurovum sp. TaxID=1969726 RepID=UPI0026005427|nr:NAD nucleotidase [Sulfurovum sp.]
MKPPPDDLNVSLKKAISFNILHMNDIHSHIESETYSFYVDGVKVKGQLGGMARAATKMKALQKTYGKNVLTINAGDLIQGTFYFTAFDGNATSAMFNQIDWDVFELGNHEFDNGDAFLAKLLDSFKPSVDVIAANVVPKAGNVLENKWQPYVIKEIDGEKVGIVGIDIVHKTKVSSRPSDDIKFTEEAATAQKYIDELKDKGVNKIILVSHIGYENDLDIVKKLDGVDVIIGGDSHTLMGDFGDLGLKSATNDYPKEATDAKGNKVCIAQAWQYSYVVGDVHVDFDKEGQVTACNGKETLLLGEPFVTKNAAGKYANLADVNASLLDKLDTIIAAHPSMELVAEDADALSILEPFKKQINAKKKEVVGSAKEDIGHSRIPYDKYDGQHVLPHGSEIAPIVCASFMEEDPNADVCIQNAGGARIPVSAGEITLETAYRLLPFKNTLFEIQMKGSEIKQVLEDALANYIDDGGSTGSFPYAYALRYDINASQSKNHRIGNLEVMDKAKNWSTIDDTKMYTVITNSYISSGHDGYYTFKTVQEQAGRKGVDTYLDYAMSFVDYVKNHTESEGGISKLPESLRPIKCYVDDTHPTCPVEGRLHEGASVALDDMKFDLGKVTFSNGFELNATWGLGSGAAHKKGDDNSTFYTLTDRGVNIKCKDDVNIVGIDICLKGKIFPFPDFTPTIVKFKLSGDKAVVEKIIPLKDKNGKPISGVSNPLSNFTEKAYDINGNEMTYDPNGLDTEALAVLSDGTFWIGEEYAPSLVHVDADGKIMERLVPSGLEGDLSAATYKVRGVLPAIIGKRHENRGIESIAVSADGKTLYYALQSPLDNPDYTDTNRTRIYSMNLETNESKLYLYELDAPDTFTSTADTKKTRKQKDVKVSEMTLLANGHLLVDERISSSKLYEIDLSKETSVSEAKSSDLETEDLAANSITPITKTLRFKTESDAFPTKIEGVADLGGGSFFLINDNDFGIEGDKTVGKMITVDALK